MSDEIGYELYAKAGEELDSGKMDRGVWARAFAETSNKDEASRLYIKYRAAQLQAINNRLKWCIKKASEEFNSGKLHQATWEKISGSENDREAAKRKYILERGAFWGKVYDHENIGSKSVPEEPEVDNSSKTTSTEEKTYSSSKSQSKNTSNEERTGSVKEAMSDRDHSFKKSFENADDLLAAIKLSTPAEDKTYSSSKSQSKNTLNAGQPNSGSQENIDTASSFKINVESLISDRYRLVFIGSILVAIALFLLIISQDSSNQFPTVIWIFTAWYIHKHKYKELVISQKVMCGLAGTSFLWALISPMSQTQSEILGVRNSDLLISSLISFILHFSLLRFFTVRLNASKQVVVDVEQSDNEGVGETLSGSGTSILSENKAKIDELRKDQVGRETINEIEVEQLDEESATPSASAKSTSSDGSVSTQKHIYGVWISVILFVACLIFLDASKKQRSSNESVVKSLPSSFSAPGYAWFTGDKVTKTGKGKYVWADGDVYIGELKEGRQEGRGLLFSGGTVKKGLWFSGKWYQSADVKIEEFSSKILSD